MAKPTSSLCLMELGVCLQDASSSSSSSAAGPPAAAASVAPTEIGGGGDEVGRVGVSGSGGGQQSGGTMGGGEGDVEMGTEGSVAAGGGGGGGGGAPHRAESSASVSSSSAAIVPTGAARSGSSSASVTGGPEGAGAQSQKQPDAKPPSYSIVGYMERRCDFETEYDNDAEMIVADLEFRPEEPPEETELKLNALEIFNCKLDERMRRKAFAVHRNLLDIRAQQAKDRKRTRDERDYHQILRAAQRFHPDVEHEEFVKCLITERRLRERAEKLREWRQKGIRTFREAAELESIGQAREVQNKKPTYSSNQTSSSTNAFTFHPEKEVVTALKKTGRKWVMDQEEIDAVGGVGRRGKGDTMTAHSQTHTEGQGEGEGDTEGGGRGGGILGRSGHSSLGSVDESMGLGLGGEGEGEGGEGVEAPGEGGEERDAGAPKEMQFGPQDEYSILPGWDLLDENEKKVSSRLQIPPQHFLSMKKMIVDAQISLGFLTQSETHKVFKMDTSRAGELYEFGVSARLIERPTEGNAAAADAVEAAEKAEKEKEKADKKAAAAQAAAIAGADKDKIIAGAQQPPPSKLRRV
uniref:Transcriptional adapter 2-alpha/beta-like domain-containing protein n=1 Tax=Chromera velia CCMP2878 TaxID=1169474 RepID=A0A0G4FGK8_9ALVE|eukprot:Cvel_16886.t1-p1 / transcript=Cvel_16886.t1 / gene=Cvel_16886 / organism=Chromera_velia_CCMP2878 / gene_product=Transcriptional adapter ADA2b, putative / transcript_product=Transcriptional adapter ADA2b, putative / location=Cvel_scaffold1321:43191-49469(-) / protein_length=578 / sequence_SO=supercontig / SO=protein_coding / is_pseudo=false